MLLGILSLLIISSMLGISITPATAHTEEFPYRADLIAGGGNPESAIDVGDVFVWNDGESLYVKYQTIDDWYMVEAHLAVNTTLAGIPQTPNKKGNGGGNPIPGHFEWKREYCPPDQDDLFVIDLDGWNIGTLLYIAAHAEVIHIVSSCDTIASDSDVVWEELPDIWQPAVPCWTHGSWPSIPGANWIWRTDVTDPAGEYMNVPQYSSLPDEFGWLFKKEFTLPDTAHNIIGEMDVTADNSYKLWINDINVGGDGTMQKDGPDSQEWNTIETYDISDEITSGENDISIRALNYFSWGTPTSNPAGLIFKAEICYDYIDMEETAWGVDPGEPMRFNEKNWATYFTYTVQSAETYFIEYPETGNVYIGYEDWPDGDFDYNDFGMTLSLEEVYDQEWNLMKVLMNFTAVIYDSGMDHLIHIKRPIIGESTVTIERINHIPSLGPILGKDETLEGVYPFDGDVDIILFNTNKYSHPQKQIGEKVLIEIIVHDPLSNPKDLDPTPPREFLNEALDPFYDMDPIMANYDPWEEGTLYGSLFHIHSIQSTFQFGTPAIDVPYILVVPYPDWIPPYESTFILSPYGHFGEFYRYGTASNWYEPIMVTNNFVGPGGLSWGPYP
ncbi:MAG: hypothetical protein ACFE88_13950 [Candidatus Hermodarchaeota archaeon]